MDCLPGGTRLWRVRKLHGQIDAKVRADNEPELQLVWGDRIIYSRRWSTQEQVKMDADAKLAELQRVGWTSHW